MPKPLPKSKIYSRGAMKPETRALDISEIES